MLACPEDHQLLAEHVSDGANPETITEQDDTTVDSNALHDTHPAIGDETAIRAPFAGTPTSLATVGLGEVTSQAQRGAESVPPPTAQPASDPTDATRLNPFVHLVTGTLVGEFVIEKLLGSGGMGAVYGAHHERLGRRAAVKVIAPGLSTDRDAVERFEQEARALARLSHPNIVGVLGFGAMPGDGRSYFVMEWLEGRSLGDRIHDGSVDRDLALDILDQIARALDAAHAAGIVHRDLKPDNCWLHEVAGEPRPIVKLLDFGLAKLRAYRRSEETCANVMFGTPQYMSPEQCRSARDVGPATDVYALGCMMFELVCGRLPFTHDNGAELIVAHQFEDPPFPRDVDPSIDGELDGLIVAMLAKDSAQRPALAVVRSGIGAARTRLVRQVASNSSQVIASPATRRGRRAAVALGAAALILLAFFASLVVRSGHDATADQAAAGIDAGPVNRSVVEPAIDAGMTITTPSMQEQTSELVTAPVDASISVPRQPARRARQNPPQDTQVLPRDQADAGTVVDPTVIEIDAGVPANKLRPQPDTTPRVDDPQVRRPAGSDPKETRSHRDQTFNPFTKKPTSR